MKMCIRSYDAPVLPDRRGTHRIRAQTTWAPGSPDSVGYKSRYPLCSGLLAMFDRRLNTNSRPTTSTAIPLLDSWPLICGGVVRGNGVVSPFSRRRWNSLRPFVRRVMKPRTFGAFAHTLLPKGAIVPPSRGGPQCAVNAGQTPVDVWLRPWR